MMRVFAFDADDTLWDCQSHFEAVQERFYALLARYGDEKALYAELYLTETANMPLLGFGTKAFTLSLVETAVRVSGGTVSGEVIGELIRMGKSLLSMPTPPLPGVEATLRALCGHRLVVFTKGELLDQQGKLMRSGLAPFFERVIIVSDKTEQEYLNLCEALSITPEELVMVGNSFRSDIAPAIAVGATAIHIPYHVSWQLEQADEFAHERIITLQSFSDLLTIIPRLA